MTNNTHKHHASHINTHTRTHAHMHTHTRTHTHIPHTHTHTHTHTPCYQISNIVVDDVCASLSGMEVSYDRVDHRHVDCDTLEDLYAMMTQMVWVTCVHFVVCMYCLEHVYAMPPVF